VTDDEQRRRQSEDARILAEARWRAIIDSAVDGIIVIGAAGAIESFNPAAQRLFGYTEAEVIGRNVSMLMPSPYREEHDGYLAHYLRTGQQKIIGIGREVTGRRHDGTTFPIHLAVAEMRVGDERHFTGIVHDLTARVRLEEQLREQTSLARLGEMAAVIAHEVKNPLAAVRGAIQVIGGRLPPDSRDAPVLKEIIARLDALHGLLEDLLLFARTPQPRLAAVDLAGVLRSTADLLTRDPAFADVKVDVTGGGPPIPGDPDLLEIVLQNLLINAGQAMNGHGSIAASVSEEGHVQRIRLADSGPGMSEDVRQNLFRPFFTTKARGTGLGLSTAKRIVEAHGGTVRVELAQGRGTTIVVELPVGGV
jgi:two-component system, LuxR family, sensor kinase FixL